MKREGTPYVYVTVVLRENLLYFLGDIDNYKK